MKSNKLLEGNPTALEKEMLDTLQRESFNYFMKEASSKTGLIIDKTQKGSPASIAATGMALSSYIMGVERDFVTRAEAVKRTLRILNFFYNSEQGKQVDATGYKGFYYHFLDMETGKRAWKSELSTADTAILMGGILSAGSYYAGNNKSETEIRSLAKKLYERVDWQWALNKKEAISHGWKPETGFLHYSWNKLYSEAHIIYILALGSPTFPISKTIYNKWINTFEWINLYGIDCLYAGPLFIHQIPQVWLPLKGINDELNKKIGIDYFENSRRAALVQQQYAIENPLKFAHYGKYCWGFTASDGPGPATRTIDGVKRKFYNYKARGVPYGPDDGTISPWAVVASIPFAPRIVISTMCNAIEKLDFEKHYNYGFDASYNPSFQVNKKLKTTWISKWQFGLNQGPVNLMIENYKTGLIWNIMKKCPVIINGLRNAGFTGGWLDEIS